MDKLQEHYAGDNSLLFWETIWSVKDEALFDELYGLGVDLQNLEGKVLKMLANAKKDKRLGRYKWVVNNHKEQH